METWIRHMRVAEGLLALFPHLDEAAFTCSNYDLPLVDVV